MDVKGKKVKLSIWVRICLPPAAFHPPRAGCSVAHARDRIQPGRSASARSPRHITAARRASSSCTTSRTASRSTRFPSGSPSSRRTSPAPSSRSSSATRSTRCVRLALSPLVLCVCACVLTGLPLSLSLYAYVTMCRCRHARAPILPRAPPLSSFPYAPYCLLSAP